MLTGALVKKGDVAGADQVMEGVLKNNAASSDLRMGYVRLLIESNQRAQASEQLKKILAVDPDYADAHFAVGLLALDDHQFDEAESHFLLLAKTGAKAGEHAQDAEYYLGRIAEIRHQPQAAFDHYEKVVSGNQALDAALRRASMLAKLGKLQEARDTLDALRRQFPPLADRFYSTEGDILLQANQNDEALALFNKALTQIPGNADLLYSRSLVYERIGRTDPGRSGSAVDSGHLTQRFNVRSTRWVTCSWFTPIATTRLKSSSRMRLRSIRTAGHDR